MDGLIGLLSSLGHGHEWLITANQILSILLLAWLLRYRRLYATAEMERRNKQNLINNLAEGIYTSTPSGRMLSANPALVRLNGYASESELIASVGDIATEWYVDPKRRADFRRQLMEEGYVTDFVSQIYRHKTRERIWVSESARMVYDPVAGKPLYYEGSVRDITEDVRRFQLEERLDRLTSQVPGGFYQVVVTADGRMTAPYASSGLMETLGRSGAFDPYAVIRWVHEDDRSEVMASQVAARKDNTPWAQVFRIRTESGAIRWIQAFATPEPIDDGVIWHGHLHDTTERKQRELEIADLAFFDSLTRLPNRRMLLDRLPQAIASAARRGNCGAILFIDLDDFKAINDTFGHAAGDDFLVEIGGRLRRAVRRNDIVARLGGDEFVILLEDVGKDAETARETARAVAAKAQAGLRAGFRVGKVHHLVTSSIGVVVFDGTETSADDLLKYADLAMYDTKVSGKSGINVFDPTLLSREAERYQLVRELHEAITWERLLLHFQPVIDRHGRVCGAEGLLRWPHPTRGLLGPEDFVLLAERAGLVNELTRHVLDMGVQALSVWQSDSRTAHLSLSLNIGMSAFMHPDFTANLRRLIDLHEIEANKLTLELTEQIMSRDKDAVRRRMEEAKALGVRFSLDDFGTGRSSVENLKLFLFDEIKIDGGYVSRMETQEVGRMLVKTVLAMAKALEIEAVAEHVETERQLDFLMENGCDRFQGYLFASPKPSEDFLLLVRGDPALERAKVVPLPFRA